MVSPKTEASARGAEGEEAAARYLAGQRLKVLHRHYQTRWGEVDLICRDKETWVFVEVKTRARPGPISALDAMTPAKQKRLVNVALSFMKKQGLKGENIRFDVITIEAGRLEWYPSAFEPAFPYTY
jgi:putative endonuclease